MKKLKKTSITLAFLLLFALSGIYLASFGIAFSYDEHGEIKNSYRGSNGKARWISSNGQSYLEIYSKDYYQLGYLTGQYLVQQILLLHNILNSMMQQYNIPQEQALYIAKMYEVYIPECYKEEMQGIADSIELLSYDDILLQICFLDAFYGQIIPQMTGLGITPIKIVGCTAIASKNKGNSITLGQSMDFGYIFKDTLSFVKYKVKGKPTVFALKMGAMQLPLGKNRRVSSTITLVQTVVQGEINIPTMIKGKMAIENSKTAKEFQDIMTSSGFCSSWNWIIGDRYGNIFATESIPSSYIENLPTEFTVRTNTYLSPYFKPYLLNSEYSIKRQNKAEQLTLEAVDDSVLSLNEFMEILSYNDGTDSSICRYPNPLNPTDTATLAFFGAKKRHGYFGLGNPVEDSWGILPI